MWPKARQMGKDSRNLGYLGQVQAAASPLPAYAVVRTFPWSGSRPIVWSFDPRTRFGFMPILVLIGACAVDPSEDYRTELTP